MSTATLKQPMAVAGKNQSEIEGFGLEVMRTQGHSLLQKTKRRKGRPWRDNHRHWNPRYILWQRLYSQSPRGKRIAHCPTGFDQKKVQ